MWHAIQCCEHNEALWQSICLLGAAAGGNFSSGRGLSCPCGVAGKGDVGPACAQHRHVPGSAPVRLCTTLSCAKVLRMGLGLSMRLSNGSISRMAGVREWCWEESRTRVCLLYLQVSIECCALPHHRIASDISPCALYSCWRCHRAERVIALRHVRPPEVGQCCVRAPPDP